MNNLIDIREKVIRGIVTLILRDFGLKSVSIIGQIVLVRLVAPEYFGIFAVILFTVSLFELFTDFGLSQAIVQSKAIITDKQLGTIFCFKMMLGIIAFSLLLISFPIIKLFYRQLSDDNFLMVAVVGSIILIKSMKSVFFAIFDKELNFNIISKIDASGVIVYVITAIVFAFYKVNIWNFVFAIFLKEVIELGISFHYNRSRLHLAFDLKSIKPMLKYGSFLQIGNIIAFAEKSIVPIVGFRLSSHSIGLLDWSSKVAGLSNTLFENFGRAAFSGMVKIQDEKDKLSQAINKSVSILNIISFLFIVLVLGFGKEFMIVALSDRWLTALPALYWFSSGLLFFAGSITIAHALLAMGKSKEVAIFSGIVVASEIILAFLLTAYIGFVGIAIASFTGNIIQLIGYYFLGRQFDLRIELRRPFLDKLLVFTISGFTVLLLNRLLLDFFFTTLILKIILTIGVYGLFTFLFSKKDGKELFLLTRLFKAKNP